MGEQENNYFLKENHFLKETYLDRRLASYAKTSYYPFHMPGHKRAVLPFENPYQIDITEIEGFDNLHQAQGILREAQERLRELCRSKKSYYLVNGSTCGILSAVGALVKPGDHILIARNCHKSVYNAAKLFHLRVDYLYPQFMDCGIQGPIDMKQAEWEIRQHSDIKLVVLTSPTYEGIVSDIGQMVELSEKYQFYLIVDEAHGAHFSMHPYFPESAIQKQADVVIQSLHKTLPCFTQTAALHIASGRVDCSQIEDMLGIFQTSSPSYLLMAGIEQCVRMLEESGSCLFERYCENLDRFYKQCGQLKNLHVLAAQDYEKYGVFDVDRSKIVIRTLRTSMDGYTLYKRLLDNYQIQLEMYSAQYVLAMTSIMDTQEGFDRLMDALMEIDAQETAELQKTEEKDNAMFLQRAYAPRQKAMELYEAAYLQKDGRVEEMERKDCAGKVCAEFISLYPPGIPMIVPGEIISDSFIEILEKCAAMGLHVQGTKDWQYRNIRTAANWKGGN